MGIGASHQTGWTGCHALIIELNGRLTEEMLGQENVETLAYKADTD